MPVLTRAAASRRCYSDLPDDLLERIFAKAGLQEGRSITGVCTHWRAVFYSTPALWRTFILAPSTMQRFSPAGADRDQCWAAWFSAKRTVLARVARFVETFNAGVSQGQDSEDSVQWGAHHGGIGECLPDFLALLQPATLRCAMLWWEVGRRVMRHLVRFTRLQSLLLFSSEYLSGSVAAMLPQLSSTLTSLELHVHEVTAEDWLSVLQLTGLQRLVLVPFNAWTGGFNFEGSVEGAQGWPEGEAMLQLTRLCKLRELVIDHRPTMYTSEEEEFEVVGVGLLVLPPPASMPALEAYTLKFQHESWYGDGCKFKVGGAEFVQCEYKVRGANEPALEISRLSSLDTLQELLEALVPAGKPLSSLDLCIARPGVINAASVEDCTALGSLDSLHLESLEVEEATLGSLLRQAPNLRELILGACLDGEVPACVRAKKGLQRLVMVGNGLTSLPPGPYLEDVEWIDLADNAFCTLPPSLTGAPAVWRLEVDHNPALRLSSANAAILQAMPSLRVLIMPLRGAREIVVERLLTSSPQLDIWESPREYSPERFAEVEEDGEMEVGEEMQNQLWESEVESEDGGEGPA